MTAVQEEHAAAHRGDMDNTRLRARRGLTLAAILFALSVIAAAARIPMGYALWFDWLLVTSLVLCSVSGVVVCRTYLVIEHAHSMTLGYPGDTNGR